MLQMHIVDVGLILIFMIITLSSEAILSSFSSNKVFFQILDDRNVTLY